MFTWQPVVPFHHSKVCRLELPKQFQMAYGFVRAYINVFWYSGPVNLQRNLSFPALSIVSSALSENLNRLVESDLVIRILVRLQKYTSVRFLHVGDDI